MLEGFDWNQEVEQGLRKFSPELVTEAKQWVAEHEIALANGTMTREQVEAAYHSIYSGEELELAAAINYLSAPNSDLDKALWNY